MAAWKALVCSWTGVTPLLISLVNPGVAEIFFDGKDFQKAWTALQTFNVQVDDPRDQKIGQRDLTRRATAYTSSRFLLLRRCTLAGFSTPLKHQLLQKAGDLAYKYDKLTRQRIQYAVARDLEWLRETEGDAMDEVGEEGEDTQRQ
jgi:hypothetical protein